MDLAPQNRSLDCRHFTNCGGCRYEFEHDHTTRAQAELNKIVSALSNDGDLRVSYWGSETSEGFRYRVLWRIHIEESAAKVGYFAPGTHDLTSIKRCKTAAPALNDLLNTLLHCRWEGFSQARFRLDIQVLANGQCLINIIPGDTDATQQRRFIEALSTIGQVVHCCLHQDPERPLFLIETDLSVNFFSASGVFIQSHVALNRQLRRRLLYHLTHNRIRHIVDAYCGNGNLSLAAAQSGIKVMGFEENPFAVLAATKSVDNGKLNATYHCQKLNNHFSLPAAEGLIVDPPRAGLSTLAARVLEFSGDYIFYVSCNPTAMLRDFQLLKAQWRPNVIELFDMFPFTNHRETLVVFERR